MLDNTVKQFLDFRFRFRVSEARVLIVKDFCVFIFGMDA